MNRIPKAIIWDLDGTLIDSEPSHKASEVEVLAQFGINITEEDILPYMGLTMPHFLQVLGEKYQTQVDLDPFLNLQIPILGAYVRDQIQIFPDADAFWQASAHLPCALGTSSLPWYVERIQEKFNPYFARFKTIIHAGHVAQGKPHPEVFLKCLSALDVQPADCWVLEDSANGVAAAKAAGCVTIGIDREGRGHLSKADTQISDLRQLIPWLS